MILLLEKVTPGAQFANPQFWRSADTEPGQILEQLIFRDMVDVLYDPLKIARRRQQEWPTLNPHIKLSAVVTTGTTHPSTCPGASVAVVKNEAAKCDTNQGIISDLHVYTEARQKSPNWTLLLRNLFWRAGRQSAVWDLFLVLVDRGFLSFDSVTLPIDLMNISPNTGLVVELLYCFSYVKQDMRKIQAGEIALQSAEWLADIEWLATMIVRSGADLYQLFETIRLSQLLGELDMKQYENFKELNPDAHLEGGEREREREREGKLLPNGQVNPADNTFKFWLPHGLSADGKIRAVQIRACLDHFNAIEKAYCESEGIRDLARLAMGVECDSEGRIQKDTSDVVDDTTE